jgi:hypothetical protein
MRWSEYTQQMIIPGQGVGSVQRPQIKHYNIYEVHYNQVRVYIVHSHIGGQEVKTV